MAGPPEDLLLVNLANANIATHKFTSVDNRCEKRRINEFKSLADQARHIRTTSAGWMIHRRAVGLNDTMKARLSEQNLTLDQVVLLMTLAEGDGLTQTEIGARVRFAGYTVTRALDALSARGLVERRPDPKSRRAHRVVMTVAGRAQMQALFGTVERQNADLLAPLTAAERDAFVATLTKLVASHRSSDGCD